jgi:hypothetical protein
MDDPLPLPNTVVSLPVLVCISLYKTITEPTFHDKICPRDVGHKDNQATLKTGNMSHKLCARSYRALLTPFRQKNTAVSHSDILRLFL